MTPRLLGFAMHLVAVIPMPVHGGGATGPVFTLDPGASVTLETASGEFETILVTPELTAVVPPARST